MFVVKRNGRREPVQFDKITARINKLCYGLDSNYIDATQIAMKVIEGLYDGVTTSALDNLAAETVAYMTTTHPDYAKLAARISVSNLHRNTKKVFSETIEDLYRYIDPKTDENASQRIHQHQNTLKTCLKRIYIWCYECVINKYLCLSYDFPHYSRTITLSHMPDFHGRMLEKNNQNLECSYAKIWGVDTP